MRCLWWVLITGNDSVVVIVECFKHVPWGELRDGLVVRTCQHLEPGYLGEGRPERG